MTIKVDSCNTCPFIQKGKGDDNRYFCKATGHFIGMKNSIPDFPTLCPLEKSEIIITKSTK